MVAAAKRFGASGLTLRAGSNVPVDNYFLKKLKLALFCLRLAKKPLSLDKRLSPCSI